MSDLDEALAIRRAAWVAERIDEALGLSRTALAALVSGERDGLIAVMDQVEDRLVLAEAGLHATLTSRGEPSENSEAQAANFLCFLVMVGLSEVIGGIVEEADADAVRPDGTTIQ